MRINSKTNMAIKLWWIRHLTTLIRRISNIHQSLMIATKVRDKVMFNEKVYLTREISKSSYHNIWLNDHLSLFQNQKDNGKIMRPT